MNKVFLMGRLTKDPDMRYPSDPSGKSIAKFTLAVDRRYTKGEQKADFFSCTAFGKQAEFAANYLHKGTKIVLTGRIENNNYTNRNGEKVYGMQVISEEIEFAESKKASQEHTSGNQQPETDGFMAIPDDVTDDELPWN